MKAKDLPVEIVAIKAHEIILELDYQIDGLRVDITEGKKPKELILAIFDTIQQACHVNMEYFEGFDEVIDVIKLDLLTLDFLKKQI